MSFLFFFFFRGIFDGVIFNGHPIFWVVDSDYSGWDTHPQWHHWRCAKQNIASFILIPIVPAIGKKGTMKLALCVCGGLWVCVCECYKMLTRAKLFTLPTYFDGFKGHLGVLWGHWPQMVKIFKIGHCIHILLWISWDRHKRILGQGHSQLLFWMQWFIASFCGGHILCIT